MKYEELQYERLGDANKTYPASTLVIRKQFVDAAIEELRHLLQLSEENVDRLTEKLRSKIGEIETLKAEADKVISDLEIKLATAQQVLRLNKPEALYSNLETMGRLKHETDVVARRECHQKHKRCLAMAKWCFTKSNYHFVLARHGEDAKENNRRSILYSKWRKRWLKIAKKFKEAKCR